MHPRLRFLCSCIGRACNAFVVASDDRGVGSGGLDRRSWNGLNLSKGVQVLVLPLIDAHVQFFPFALERFISEFLTHFVHRKIVEEFLVVDEVVVHRDQLPFDLLHINF